MRFEFASASRIIFGPGTLKEAPGVAEELLHGSDGRRVLLVTGRCADRAAGLIEGLNERGFSHALFPVAREPTVEIAAAGAELARSTQCRLVIGLGGGSVLDAAKAIAALAVNDGDPLDYLEVIGNGRALERPPLPCMAIPTTAGTGSEVTRNAVLASAEHRVKVSLRSPLMLPRVALVDSELTWTVRPDVTAATGLDALTQLIEPYVSVRAHPMTDAICREGIVRAARSLRQACERSDDAAAREDMAVASLFGGLALANAGLGAVHGFAGPIGGMFPAPHGAVCAILLPHVMRANVEALRRRAQESRILARYDEIARMVTGSPATTAEDGIQWVRSLVADFKIPTLGTYGMTADDVQTVVEKASVASSMRANSIPLTLDELRGILHAAL